MNKTFNILSSIPGFSDLSETQFEEIKQIIVNRHYKIKVKLFFQKEMPESNRGKRQRNKAFRPHRPGKSGKARKAFVTIL
jgi:hypothetical protein